MLFHVHVLDIIGFATKINDVCNAFPKFNFTVSTNILHTVTAVTDFFPTKTFLILETSVKLS